MAASRIGSSSRVQGIFSQSTASACSFEEKQPILIMWLGKASIVPRLNEAAVIYPLRYGAAVNCVNLIRYAEALRKNQRCNCEDECN